MTPDLGTYAIYVLAAYGVSLVLLVGIVWQSLRRAARVRAELAQIEAQKRG